jgi:outer membrane protein assembly factor BamB
MLGKGRGAFFGRTFLCAAAWVLTILAAANPSAKAQQFTAVFGEATPVSATDPQQPFILPTQPAPILEALEEFDQHANKGRWEQAFTSLEKVVASTSPGLVARSDGVLLPTNILLRQALADLPPAGKEAYRLFHDAEAKALFDNAQGDDEAAKLEQILARHLVTSVGDTATDRLGDLYFEQGNVEQAAQCWRTVLTFCPESAIPRAQLLVKTAIALARAGRWEECRQIEAELHERHAGEKVVLGGANVDAESHIARLVALAASTGSASPAPTSTSTDVTLPSDNQPAWQFRLLSKSDVQALANMGNNWGWGRLPVADMVPPAVLDESRIYVNLLGYHFALDANNGKLLWRSGRFTGFIQKLNQGPYISAERHSLAVAPDRLWSVSRDVDKLGQPGAVFRLAAWDKGTGKQVFSSQSVSGLQNWNMAGRPLPLGERIYVAAYQSNQGNQLHVLALQATDGKLLWSAQVGTHQVDLSQVYHQRTPQPVLMEYGGKLYVETHDGAMAELDAKTGALNWGLAYESERLNTERWYNEPAKLRTSGEPLFAGGTLFVKGMSSPRLYAIDVASPRLQWKRPVAQSALVIGADDERLYLGGEEITAINLRTRQLDWSTRLPWGTSWTRPLMTDHRLYQFTPRGIYELDKATGDVVRLFRGADLDSAGGVLLATPQTLIALSNSAITAYEIQSP